MEILSVNFLESIFKQQKENTLFGKWIKFEDIKGLFEKYNSKFQIKEIGKSEQKRPIMSLKIGTGNKKILLWSQMHGNESTATKALFDLFNCFTNSNLKEITTILDQCTLLFIPMLNPDGSEVYTRVNAYNIDLNRDAVALEAVESKLLRKILEEFNPNFCFNLHDQRTIFGVEGTKNPATISFLAPSEEESRKITEGRKKTMNVIISMNKILQEIIPNFVGRYTDEFYPTATGDNFQKLGYNTILIESGHFPKDYNREESRKFTFYSILQGVYHIATESNFKEYKEYFNIPDNAKIFYDVIHRFLDSRKDIAFQYEDKIVKKQLVSKLVKINDKTLKNKIGHNEIVFES